VSGVRRSHAGPTGRLEAPLKSRPDIRVRPAQGRCRISIGETLARQNYGYAKHQKEIAKKKKQEEKRRRKLAKRQQHSDENTSQPDGAEQPE